MTQITISLTPVGRSMPDYQMESWARDVLHTAASAIDGDIKEYDVSNALAIAWLQVLIKENPQLGENVNFVLHGVPSKLDSDYLLDWRDVPDMGGANEAFKRLFGF